MDFFFLEMENKVSVEMKPCPELLNAKNIYYLLIYTLN